jgi:hypothetical protein
MGIGGAWASRAMGIGGQWTLTEFLMRTSILEHSEDATLTMDNEACGQCVHGQKLRSASMEFLLKARSR